MPATSIAAAQVLVVDDEPDLRTLYELALLREGYHVDAAGSVAQARELPVVLACRTGAGSADAARKLVKGGFKQVHWLDGGVAAWQQASLPLVKGRA